LCADRQQKRCCSFRGHHRWQGTCCVNVVVDRTRDVQPQGMAAHLHMTLFSRFQDKTGICSHRASELLGQKSQHLVKPHGCNAGCEVSSEGHGADLFRPGNRRMTRFLVFWVGGQGFSTLWEMSNERHTDMRLGPRKHQKTKATGVTAAEHAETFHWQIRKLKHATCTQTFTF
jgi:hypothetical protein